MRTYDVSPVIRGVPLVLGDVGSVLDEACTALDCGANAVRGQLATPSVAPVDGDAA